MTPELLAKAALLGLVEGVTEFIPVSSTGHLIVASHWLGETGEAAKTFDIFIQLGAILAVIVLYWRTFWAVAVGLFGGEPTSFRFVVNLLLAFLPSAVLGLILIDQIEALPQVEIIYGYAGYNSALIKAAVAAERAASSSPGSAMAISTWRSRKPLAEVRARGGGAAQ